MNGVQVRNLFLVRSLKTGADAVSSPGDLKVVHTNVQSAGSKLFGKDAMQLQYVNPDGKLIVSDFIEKGQYRIELHRGVGTPLKEAVLKLVDLDPDGTGYLVSGEDYVVDINIRQYLTLDERSVLSKFGAVHATKNMTTHEFMFKLAKSFVANFRRDADLNPFFEFYLAEVSGDTYTNASKVTFDTATPGSWTADTTKVYCLVIREQQQPVWYRGTYPMQSVNFDIVPHTIYSNGDEVLPFTTEGESGMVKVEPTTSVINNGYDLADIEYACHGEIGDQIREYDYQRSIRTKYAFGESDVNAMYDTVELYFYFIGRNNSPEKSEKQITLAIKHGGDVTPSDLLSALDFTSGDSTDDFEWTGASSDDV